MSTAPIIIDIDGMKFVVNDSMKELSELRMICDSIIRTSTESPNQNRRRKLEVINTDAKSMGHRMDKIYQQLMAVYVSLGFMNKEDQQ